MHLGCPACRSVDIPGAHAGQWFARLLRRAYSASAAFLRPRFFIVPALASATAKMMALSSG